MNNNLCLDVQNLTKKFGDFTAVNDISFKIPRGSIFGFLGPNGAGKSTTIRMLLGIIPPTSGSGNVLGFDIIKQSEEIRARVGYMSQKFSLYTDLTVLENLDFFGGIFDIPSQIKAEQIRKTLSLTKLEGYENQLTEDLPRGVRQRLAFAVSLLHDPEIVFLDEPTGGVDPALRRYFWDVIAELSQQGKTVMVTSHYMDEVERCDNICFIYKGTLIARGSPSGLKRDYIKGSIYSIETKKRVEALELLEKQTWARNPFPTGNFVRFLVEDKSIAKETIEKIFSDSGFEKVSLETVKPTLEDVFVALVETER